MIGGYDSSDDEVNAADHAADAFGITRIEAPISKKTRMDGEGGIAPKAAPDVLAEVRTVLLPIISVN